MSFTPISPNEDHTGLVWSGQVTPQYLVELQTGILPQLLHLVFFDTLDGNKVVYEEIRAFEIGDTLDKEARGELQKAIAVGLKELS